MVTCTLSVVFEDRANLVELLVVRFGLGIKIEFLYCKNYSVLV